MKSDLEILEKEATNVVALQDDMEYLGGQQLASEVIDFLNNAAWVASHEELAPLSRAIRFALTIATPDNTDRPHWERMLAEIKDALA